MSKLYKSFTYLGSSVKAKAAKVTTKLPASKARSAAKPVLKSATKPVAKTALKAKTKAVPKPSAAPPVPAKSIVVTQAVAPEKQSSKNVAKQKLVRDSFTLPESDHELIKQCKKTAIAAGRETKKSEVIRAAIRAFSSLPTTAQLAAYASLQSIAVGRPKAK
jgi:hypothetical protein